MDELNQFLNSVEASARKILKQQNKKQQELLIRDRMALTRNGNKKTSNSISSSNGDADSGVSRDELRATYGGGSSLIIQAPSPRPHPVSLNGHRSEHASESEDAKYLPRLSGQSSGNEPLLRGSTSANAFLPAIDRKQQQQKDGAAALEAAKRANREARRASSSLKILDSPLYKSLSKVKSDQGFGSSSSPGSSSASPQSIKKAIHDVDNVNILLKKMGLREPPSSPSRRPDRAVEHRMCNACWANPAKLTGCEHHNRVLPSNGSSNNGNQDPASIIQNLELQGPKSWLSDDLYVKYRSEGDRETLWDAFVQLKESEKREQEEQQEALLQGGYSVSSSFDSQQQQNQKKLLLKVIPIVTRHPIYHKFFTQIELENLRTQAETRKRNQSRAFVFDVNHIWLTNLDHFNDSLLIRKRRQQQRALRKTETRKHGDGIDEEVQDPEDTMSDGSDNDDEDPGEANSLNDRRDEAAICQGFSQIQSISTSRAAERGFPRV